MSSSEKRLINERLKEIMVSFGLKVKLTVNNAQDFIEENYKKIREIDKRIHNRVTNLNLNF